MVILDWEMPLLNGPELVRIVRSPGVFPTPDIPIIMLTAHGERWRILEAAKLGVNELLCKPVSAKALFDRLIVDPAQAARQREARRLLRPGAAPAERSPRWRRRRLTPGFSRPAIVRLSARRARR